MGKMRRILFAVVLLAAVLCVMAWWALRPRGTVHSGVTVSFLGYTNLPSNGMRFALFLIKARDTSAIRWRGNWVEVEGLPGIKQAPVVNRGLPWLSEPTTHAGASLVIAIGEPKEAEPWKYGVVSSPYGLRERLFDFLWRHDLPMRLGPVQLFDVKQVTNPTNRVTNYSVWLKKPE